MGAPDDETPLGGPALVLVEWNEGGHHESYLLLYAAELLRAGWRVGVLCRRPAWLCRALEGEAGLPNLASGVFAVREIPGPEWIAARRRWPFGLAFHVYAGVLKRELRRLEGKLGAAGGELYFCCLYEHQARLTHTVLGRLGGRVWSGLYMQPHAFHLPAGRRAPGVKKNWPMSRVWARAGLRGLLMLDEAACERVAQALKKTVQVAPDLADGALRVDDPLASRASSHAAGRPLVGLLGHILPSKGAVGFARCALRSDAAEFAFLMAGEVHWSMFTAEQADELRRMGSGRGRLWLHGERIADEAAYNALVSACDVLCAAYLDFPHSSNTLTKAAVFEKPVIVSEGHLMAQRVREFRLGEVVPQDDPEALLTAIRRLASNPQEWREQVRPRWEEYRERHSRERLREVLKEFFGPPGRV